MSKNIVTGERLQSIAPIYFGTRDKFNANPFIRNQTQKHFDLHALNQPLNNPPIVFCYSDFIHDFSKRMHFLLNDFVLISHNSDKNICDFDESVNRILLNPKCKKWYSQNVCFEHEKLEYLPIGLANSQWPHGINSFPFLDPDSLTKKTQKIYFHFNIHTNYPKRQTCYKILENKIPFLPYLKPTENFLRLKEYEFAICPEGYGMDTHRLWECLYLKTVPIVLDNPLNRILQKKGIPIKILSSWNDLDISSLHYNDYSFDDLKITMDHFTELIQQNALEKVHVHEG